MRAKARGGFTMDDINLRLDRIGGYLDAMEKVRYPDRGSIPKGQVSQALFDLRDIEKNTIFPKKAEGHQRRMHSHLAKWGAGSLGDSDIAEFRKDIKGMRKVFGWYFKLAKENIRSAVQKILPHLISAQTGLNNVYREGGRYAEDRMRGEPENEALPGELVDRLEELQRDLRIVFVEIDDNINKKGEHKLTPARDGDKRGNFAMRHISRARSFIHEAVDILEKDGVENMKAYAQIRVAIQQIAKAITMLSKMKGIGIVIKSYQQGLEDGQKGLPVKSRVGDTKRVNSFGREYDAVQTDYDITDILRSYTRANPNDYGFLFVKVGDAEYDEIWGLKGNVPYNNDYAERLA